MSRTAVASALSLALAAALVAPGAQAAESKDTCTGFIPSLPAVITTQGTWCMDHDLATTISSGFGIWIKTNNVTIDCNHFKLGDLGAGLQTQATGIYAAGSLNATVRHCNVRGWRDGVVLGGGGHAVEDSRFESNRRYGIYLTGSPGSIRNNLVADTGGTSTDSDYAGIRVVGGVDVLDNTIVGVSPADDLLGPRVYGIDADFNGAARLRGNAVRELSSSAGPTTTLRIGIRHNSGEGEISGNYVVGPGDHAIECSDASGFVFDNRMAGFSNGLNGCDDAGGNLLR